MASIALISLSPDVEAIIESVLREEGHVVTVQTLHTEAAEQLGDMGCDLVVIDGFPLVNISLFVEQLRAQEQTSAMPVVVISAGKALPSQKGVVELPLPFELLAFIAAVKQATASAD